MSPFDNATRAQASLMDAAMAGLQLASRAMELPSPRQARMFAHVKELLSEGVAAERCPDCGCQLAACVCHLAPCDICEELVPHEELAVHGRKGICDKCMGEMRAPSPREKRYGLGTD
jgi:hypothetical protein